MTEGPSDEALSTAREALEARHKSPTDALGVARSIVDRDDVSDSARLVGLWAMGAAERELSRLAEAEQHMCEAIELGVAIDEPLLVAQVSSALVTVLGARGKLDEALALAESITSHLTLVERADLEMKRAVVLEELGRLGEALDSYTAALGTVASSDDRVLEARLRCNRAVVLAYQGRIDEALDDALIAERLATEHRQYFLAGGAAHNHAFAAGLQGDIVTALASFGRADALYSRVGYPGRSAGVLASDRCELMLAAGLYDEARSNAEHAVRSLSDGHDVNSLAEAQLLLARACLAQGDGEAAHREAMSALARFEAAGRAGWTAMAEYVAVSAARITPSLSEADGWERADVIAADLERLGWTSESSSVRVSAAEQALAKGDRSFARRQLELTALARDRGRPDRRANAWLATAMLRRSELDRAGARRAIRAGLGVLADHRSSLGATDLRVGSTAHATKLANLGLRMALESRRPRDVLIWAEYVRANTLSMPVIRPPADSPLAAGLGELRRQRRELDDARRALVASRSQELAVQRSEEHVRDLARTVRGDAAGRRRFSVESLQALLGEHRRLVEFVEMDGSLSAVVVGSRRCALRPLGRVDDVASALELARFALTRLAAAGISAASRAAASASLDESLELLDALVAAPLRLRDDAVVVVPTGMLHGMPWGGLPSLRSVALTVATSATRWRPPPERNSRVAVVAGPGLIEVEREVSIVQSMYPSADTLTGDDATVGAVLELLDRSDVAHISCHGQFRRDSPMFSSLALADGPLTVYDLESLATPPSLVVLPACNAGSSSVTVGDELIGTASALLGTGVRTVIAPVTVVNDAATVDVMGELHHHLSVGLSPSEALAEARLVTADRDDPAGIGSVWSFLCFE